MRGKKLRYFNATLCTAILTLLIHSTIFWQEMGSTEQTNQSKAAAENSVRK
jgi:hypothetical protein